jgi:hypothetical protein
VSWTVPTYQAVDPNASCPPTQQEFNSGLLGCALAMIDLSSFKPVTAGSALFEYKGFPFFPPNPTLALSTSTAVPNQTVTVSDAAAATTYWWLSTLSTLESSLGTSGGASPTVTATVVEANGHSVPAQSNAQVSPATYSGGVFTPPKLSGGFTVPSTVTGPVTVNVDLTAPLEGVPLVNAASAHMFVNNPPTTSVLLPSNGASLKGTQDLVASAFDYATLTKVEFRLTGGALNNALIATGTSGLYGWAAGWNTASVPNGTYTLQSVAYDAGGLSTSSTGITVTVANPPTTTVLVPSSGKTLSGSTIVDASATNATSVKFLLFGGTYGYNAPVICTATQNPYGWACNWDTTTVPNGSYAVVSEAFNSVGSTSSSGVSIVVKN